LTRVERIEGLREKPRGRAAELLVWWVPSESRYSFSARIVESESPPERETLTRPREARQVPRPADDRTGRGPL